MSVVGQEGDTVRVLVTGGTGVLGRAFRPLAEAAGHDVRAPGRVGLDLFDPVAVGAAMRRVDAALHLATLIQPLDRMGQPEAWRENDRLRAEASAILVDAALAERVTLTADTRSRSRRAPAAP